MIQQNISPKSMTIVSNLFSLNIQISTIELLPIPSGRQNKFPFSDAEYSANAATIMGSYYMGEVCSNGFTARKL